jgi:L-alanine-DL-glutamate epimerase-like enolase superfamily enzyme
MEAGAVSHAQPSVIKVGGITEFMKVAALGDELGVNIIPHSPYFGPGFLATLHLMAVRGEGLIEVFYMKHAASLWGHHIDPDAQGDIAVPQGPGLGHDPDRGVMEKYRVS